MLIGKILRIGRIIPAKTVKSSGANWSISKKTLDKNVANKKLVVMNKRSWEQMSLKLIHFRDWFGYKDTSNRNLPHEPGIVISRVYSTKEIVFISKTKSLDKFIEGKQDYERLSEYEQKVVDEGRDLELSYITTGSEGNAIYEKSNLVHEYIDKYGVLPRGMKQPVAQNWST